MSSENELTVIRPPVAFNPFKHHLSFLTEQIKIWQNLPWHEFEKNLLLIGTNLTDLYCGELSVAEICRQCLNFAGEKDLTSAQKLEFWLSPKAYRKIQLSDHSEWIVRQGLDSSRFLHIHPAKYSPLTVRVRGTTLKTVVALKSIQSSNFEYLPDLKQINKIRSENLELSPIKALEKEKGINKIWQLFHLF